MTLYVIVCMTMVLLSDIVATTSPLKLYSVILDAGSSSTKLRVYAWPKRKSTSSLLRIKEIYSKRFEPGLSAYVDNIQSLPAYIKNITDKSLNHVPSSLYHKTPIHLLATAGLRILDEDKATVLMNEVRSILSSKKDNPYIFENRNARILSGEEEGVFAWISANYHNNYFLSKKPLGQAVGVLEMGGGSTQITFIPDGPLLANMFQIRIGGRIYHLYSHSYLYYGQNYMKLRIKRHLIQQNPNSSDIDHPCLLRNDSLVEMVGKKKTVIFRGTGRPTECLEIISSFLQINKDCYPKPCAIGSTYQPSVGTDLFYATAAYTFAIKDLNATDSSSVLNIDKMNKTAHTYCSMTLDEVKVKYNIKAKYASGNCMMGLYIPKLLTFSYGFPVDTRKIYSTQLIKGNPIDWPFGAALYQAELMEKDYPCSPINAGYPGHGYLSLIVIMFVTVRMCKVV